MAKVSFKSKLNNAVHSSLPMLLSMDRRSMFGVKDMVVACCPSSLPCVRGTKTWQLQTPYLPNAKTNLPKCRLLV